MKIKIIILILILINFSYADTNSTSISLKDFINNSFKNYPQKNINKYEINYAKARLMQAEAINDFNLKSKYYKNISNPVPEGMLIIDKQNVDSVSVNIEKILPFSGTRISTGFGLTDAEIDYIPSTSYPYSSKTFFQPELIFSINQPILKNWFGILDRIPIQQAQLNVKISREKNKEADESFILELHNLYYDWILNKEQLKIYMQNYNNSKILLKQIERKFKSGVAELVDVNKTKAMSIKYKKAIILYKSQLSIIEKNILKYYTGNIQSKKRIKPEPLDFKNGKNLKPDFIHMTNTRKMRILNFTKLLIDKELIMGKNSTLPELNLILSSTLKSYSEDKKEFNKFEYNEYTIGLALVYPLGNHLARGNIKQVKDEKDKLKNEIKDFQLTYTFNLNKLINMLHTYEEILKEDKELVETTQKQLKAEEKKYQQGRSDLYFVIETRNNLLELELNYIIDYVELQKLYIQYLDITDQLYIKYF